MYANLKSCSNDSGIIQHKRINFFPVILYSLFLGVAASLGLVSCQGALTLEKTQSTTQTDSADTTIPAAVVGFSATAGDGQVILGWVKNTDPDLDGYIVSRDNQELPKKITKTEISFIDTGLTNDQTYTYKIVAVDQAGNRSPASLEITVTPKKKITPIDPEPTPPAYQTFYPDPYYTYPGRQPEIFSTGFDGVFQKYGIGNPNVKIVVIDSGFKTANSFDAISGYVAADSVDFFGDSTFGVATYNYHGMAVIYLLGAEHNGSLVGIDGFVPGCHMCMYKVTDVDGGNIKTTNIAAAIRKAISERATVINISLGSSTYDADLLAACQEARTAGIVIVAAVDDNTETSTVYPAGFSNMLDNVIAVGGLTSTGFIHSDTPVDVYTESENIQSITPSGVKAASDSAANSFAAPIVTAAVAQMVSANPQITPLQIKTILKNSGGIVTREARQLPYLNAYNAVQWAVNGPTASESIIKSFIQTVSAVFNRLTFDLLNRSPK